MSNRCIVAFGPEAPQFGSWNWIGADISRGLDDIVQTRTFREHVPNCDIAVFVKFKPSVEQLRELRRRLAIIYVPVDLYASAAEIDGDAGALSLCDLVVIHCERLRKYFSSYTRTEYVNHHLKYVGTMPTTRNVDGPIVWIGNRSNLPPVVEWVNTQTLSGELWMLTDLPEDVCRPDQLGLTTLNWIRLENWTPARHAEWASLARAAFDVKGDDFRARHKPPAKALDWIASGIPLAMNRGSSSCEHLSKLGFSVCSLEDQSLWLSEMYWKDTQRMGRQLRETTSLERICQRWLDLILDVHQRRQPTSV